MTVVIACSRACASGRSDESEYAAGSRIGGGTYGEVYWGERTSDGLPCVIKVLFDVDYQRLQR